jgi:hypothetical protein
MPVEDVVVVVDVVLGGAVALVVTGAAVAVVAGVYVVPPEPVRETAT